MSELKLIFRPRFWGSFESRWECGTTHLTRNGDRTLCGESTGEAREEGTVPLNGPIPKRVCKRCHKAARREGRKP